MRLYKNRADLPPARHVSANLMPGTTFNFKLKFSIEILKYDQGLF